MHAVLMKTIVPSLTVVAGVAALAALQPAAPTEGEWPDTLTLSRGKIVHCRICNVSPTSLTIDYPRPGPGTQPTLRRDVSWSDIQSAEFSMDAEFHRLVAATNAVKDTPRLAARWNTLAPLIGRPHHPAGDIGLALARLSLEHPETSARHRALAVCRALADADWNPVRRHHARLFTAKILAALGRTESSLEEARRLASEPDIVPEVAMPSHVLLAEADFAALRKLEEDNPRWADDDVVRPEREALFHRALDAALKPSLFHGAIEPPATQGMWTAVQLLELDRQVPAAADCARDLLNLYPTSPRAQDAKAFLQRHRQPVDPDAPPTETPAPNAIDAVVATTNSPRLTSTIEPVVQRRPRYAVAPRGNDKPAQNQPVSTPYPSRP